MNRNQPIFYPPLPMHEQVRRPKVPPEWYSAMDFTRLGGGPYSERMGRPRKGVVCLRKLVINYLQEHPWRTSLELAEALGRDRKAIAEVLRLGIERGVFSKQLRARINEYALAQMGESNVSP